MVIHVGSGAARVFSIDVGETPVRGKRIVRPGDGDRGRVTDR
jgi:hypothetical protein